MLNPQVSSLGLPTEIHPARGFRPGDSLRLVFLNTFERRLDIGRHLLQSQPVSQPGFKRRLEPFVNRLSDFRPYAVGSFLQPITNSPLQASRHVDVDRFHISLDVGRYVELRLNGTDPIRFEVDASFC